MTNTEIQQIIDYLTSENIDASVNEKGRIVFMDADETNHYVSLIAGDEKRAHTIELYTTMIFNFEEHDQDLRLTIMNIANSIRYKAGKVVVLNQAKEVMLLFTIGFLTKQPAEDFQNFFHLCKDTLDSIKEDFVAALNEELGNDENNENDDDSPFQKISSYSFRELYQQYLFIWGEDLVESIADSFDTPDGYNGVVVYNYVDYTMGSTFEVLCAAKCNEEGLFFATGRDDARLMLRKGAVNDYDALPLDPEMTQLQTFSKKVQQINDTYISPNNSSELRAIDWLDASRSPDYPDDLFVFIFKDGLEMERIWVRINDFDDGKIFCILLNEPIQDFGIHKGDKIRVGVQKDEDTGGYICFSKL